ncbi:hypothetical protein M2G84_22695, partial [Vibrio vulnificus]|nr:hypothetical protein [Vibrio vulnificus]
VGSLRSSCNARVKVKNTDFEHHMYYLVPCHATEPQLYLVWLVPMLHNVTEWKMNKAGVTGVDETFLVPDALMLMILMFVC